MLSVGDSAREMGMSGGKFTWVALKRMPPECPLLTD
jgi:hypothetical protein